MGELTQSFAQVSNAINQTKQTNLNRDIASSNISFRNQQSDLAQRQFDAQQIQQQRDNLIENADKSLDFYTTIGELLPPSQRQELFQETSNQYKRAGLIPEGMTFDFESAEEASNKVIERTIRGDVQGAQDEIQRFKTSGFKPVVDANLPKIQADAAIAERAGNFKNIIDLRSKGLAVSRSEWEHIKTTNPQRAQQLEAGKNVYEDETIQAADRRSTELDYWRKVPPEILNDIIRIKRISDIGGVVSSPDLQKQVAASEYQSLAALASEEEAAGNVVPESLRNAMNVQLAVMGVGEKIPVENEQARLERRRLKAQEAEIRSKISSRTIENSRIIAQTNVLKATLPQIAQNIENMKATGENTQARTALFQNQLLADQKKMQAIAPRLVQARDELMQQGQEIYEQLEATANNRDMDPLEREKLYDQLEANAKATTDLNAQIEFAEAVGPELFLSYEKLGAQMQDMELRRNKNETSLNSLQQQRQALVAAQTEGKLSENQRKAQDDQRKALIAQASRELNLASPNIQKDAQTWLKKNDPENLVSVQDIAKAAGVKSPLQIQLKGPERSNRALAYNAITGLNMMKGTIGRLRPLLRPEMFGAAGSLRKTVFGLAQQGDAFGELLWESSQEMKAHAKLMGSDPEVVSKFSNRDASAAEMLKHNLTYALASMNDPKDRVSNEAYRAAAKALGSEGLLANMEDFTARIDQLEVEIDANRRVWGKLLSDGEASALTDEGEQESTSLPDMSEATDEDLMKILQGAFQ